MQAAQAAQYQKNKQPNQNWVEDLKRNVFKEDIHTDGQQKHEKMLNIAHYYRNAN